MGHIGGEFNFTQVLLMLLLDSVIYGLVAWYVEAAFPRRVWYTQALVLLSHGEC